MLFDALSAYPEEFDALLQKSRAKKNPPSPFKSFTNDKPDEKFIKSVQKAATARKMTVAEYRDKILFPHGKERIATRFKQFLKQHPEAEGKSKP